MKMKKTSQVFLLGIVLLLISTACTAISQLPLPSRKDLEDRFDKLGDIYPTKNFEDLYDKFPNGFKIDDYYYEYHGDIVHVYNVRIEGDSINRTFSGTVELEIEKIEPLETISISTYEITNIVNNRVEITADEELKKKVNDLEFLFLHFTLNQEKLATLPFDSKFESPVSRDTMLTYSINDDYINQYFNVNEKEIDKVRLLLQGQQSSLRKDQYYSSISLGIRGEKAMLLERIEGW
ncbi:hypothetical protein [Granulicatella seriolae]|uniref:Lipoprotein n=1 Tax=Granulicatella seriolae TaxID=2967226 RepID=A0ABT1WLY5_9LACT|nr:hypothetical protein [Granulicatella seriolae]